MRIKLIGGKYDGKTFIVPDDTVQYRPEGTKEIAYENQAYRIGFDVIFKLIEWREDNAMSTEKIANVNPISDCSFCGGIHYGSSSCPYKCDKCGGDIRQNHISKGLGREFICTDEEHQDLV